MARILVMTPSHSAGGGVERILEDVLPVLGAAGHDVVLALPKSRLSDPRIFLASHDIAVPVIEVGIEATSRKSRISQLADFLVAERPDLVISARIFDLYPAVARLRIGGGWSPKLVSMIYTYEPSYLWDARVWASVIDGIAVDARLIQAALEQVSHFPPHRIARLPGPVFAPYTEHRPQAGRLRLGYVGRIEQTQKRVLDLVPYLVELVEQGVDWELTIAGEGSKRTELAAGLADHGFAESVQWIGWCDRGRLYEEIYPRLDVLVHFAEWEGVTIAPREAMAHGVIPVIARFVGLDQERFFRSGENALIFEVGDSVEAARLTARLATDDDLRTHLSTNAAESRNGLYSAEVVLEGWRALVEKVLEQPVSPLREEQIPTLAFDGRLDRLPLPAVAVDWVRRSTGRVKLTRPSDEWPHTSASSPADWSRRVSEFAENMRTES